MRTGERDPMVPEDEEEKRYQNTVREDFVRACEEEGKVILYPADNELLIDIDTEEQFQIFQEHIKSLAKNLYKHRLPHLIWPSKSGLPRRHIKVVLPFDLKSPAERIALQASLGSDPMREMLSMVRCIHGDDCPTLLVEPKGFVPAEMVP